MCPAGGAAAEVLTREEPLPVVEKFSKVGRNSLDMFSPAREGNAGLKKLCSLYVLGKYLSPPASISGSMYLWSCVCDQVELSLSPWFCRPSFPRDVRRHAVQPDSRYETIIISEPEPEQNMSSLKTLTVLCVAVPSLEAQQVVGRASLDIFSPVREGMCLLYCYCSTG